MFDFVKKLIFARELQLEKGNITLLSQILVLHPISTFKYLLDKDKDNIIAKTLYISGKETNQFTFANQLRKRYKAEGLKLLELMTNVAQMAGWGEFTIKKFDVKNKICVVSVVNSPFYREYGVTKSIVDHIVRGFICGSIINIMKDTSLETLEIKCESNGDHVCEFVTRRIGDFDKAMLEKFKYQLP